MDVLHLPCYEHFWFDNIPERYFFMTSCRHLQLLLLPPEGNRLRCRHCHLTISAEELQGGYCPECHAASGRKNYDFEEIPPANPRTRYRCEQCGVIIEVD